MLKLNGWTKETLRNSSVVLATNSATEAACRALGAKDVRYFLADGLPPEYIGTARQRPTGEPVVLWVGRMLARKAPELAVQAFAELRKTMPARLVMAGDGPFLPRVEATVNRLGLSDDVDLLGRVPWPKLAELYDTSSLFLFCSLRDSLGSQFLEALGRGLPAATLDLHGISDVKVGLAAEKVPLPQRPEELHGGAGGRDAHRADRGRLGGTQRGRDRVRVGAHLPDQGRRGVADLPGDHEPTLIPAPAAPAATDGSGAWGGDGGAGGGAPRLGSRRLLVTMGTTTSDAAIAASSM